MKKRISRGFLLLLIFSFTIKLSAQTDSIDVFIKTQMQNRKIPGLQLAIVRHEKLIKTGNYGLANVQDSIPVTDKSLFTINSITKAFTGVAIMQLAESGTLSLSSPVSAYLPDLPQNWKNITILQLLSHTSGIPDIVDPEESVMINADPEEAWKQVQSLPVDFAPGERFSYNQTNYVLLGFVINKLSGMSFQDFIIKEQLEKVRMPKTIRSGFGATKDIVPNAAGGYRYSRGKLINMFFSFPPFLQTAAGMSSTASEMAEWVIALQNKKLLKQENSLTTMWTPALMKNGKTGGFSSLLNGYAVGWPVIGRSEHPAAAAVGGGRSAVFIYPNDDISIIVLTNLAGGSPEEFIDEIAGFYIPAMRESNGFGLSPSVKLLKAPLEKNGYKNAIPEIKNLQKSKKDLVIAEEEINTWGYKLINQKRLEDALEIFKLNVFLYPESANAFDSLGEIYAELGNVAQSIRSYEQSLKLDPKNRNAEEQLKRLKEK